MAVRQIAEKHFVVELGEVGWDKYNLICSKGHVHFSPEPMGFVGLECGYRGREGTVACRSKLSFLRGSRFIPPKKKKSKLRKMRRF